MSRHSVPVPDVPVGYRIGEWELTEPIGTGAWGSVYAARSTADGTPVAVKLWHTDRLAPGQRAALDELVSREVRFSQEADHPHLVRTRAVCVISDPDRPPLDGAVALVMDRADHSLQDLLDAADPETPGPVPGAERILRHVAAGLAHMHAAGRVHGDLKPANVLLTTSGETWLADFGLTAELDGTHAYMPPLGTLDHLPPEWWSERTGVRGTVVRPSADIWAFGVLAHQVLTGGRHPFPGAAARARALAAQAYARGTAPLSLDESVPAPWRALVGDCLTPDHASRSRHDAAAVLTRVRALGAPRPAARRLRRAVVGAVVLALAAAAAGAAVLLPDGTGRPTTGGAPPATASAPAAAATTPSAFAHGAIPPGSDVPVPLRDVITRAAHRCTEEEITPVVLAAMLKAESGFDADAARPRSDEYGIALWTPAVFRAWAVDGDKDGVKDYMSPADAIMTMGGYVCWLAQRFEEESLTGDMPALVAAGYRTSDRTVIEAGGVPEQVEGHVAEVRRHLARYTR